MKYRKKPVVDEFRLNARGLTVEDIVEIVKNYMKEHQAATNADNCFSNNDVYVCTKDFKVTGDMLETITIKKGCLWSLIFINDDHVVLDDLDGHQLTLKRDLFGLYFVCKSKSEEQGTSKTIWEDVDKDEAIKSVMLLDLFTKTFCRYKNDYGRFNDLKFRCKECPFQAKAGICKVKEFKMKYAPNYRDFGSMGDL